MAARKIIAGASGQLAISDLALNECIFGLERYYTYTREQIAAALEAVMRVPAINCNRVLLNKALSYYVANQNLSFEDCALVSYAELNDAKPLFTFDKQLAKITCCTAYCLKPCGFCDCQRQASWQASSKVLVARQPSSAAAKSALA